MSIKKIQNVLLEEDIMTFKSITDKLEAPRNDDGSFIFESEEDLIVSRYLGRIQLNINNMDELFPFKNNEQKQQEHIVKRLSGIASSFAGKLVQLSSTTYVEYSAKYGKPDLPPHFDGDYNDVIINYQFESNTEWDVGVAFDLYKLEDNSALVFNPNESAHWRPHKTFKENEFVKMIFFRFTDPDKMTDYSHLRKYWPMDDFFVDLRKFRDSLEIN
jgi:hypothetical protein